MMVLALWNAPEPLTRAWCLFEIYSTVVEGKPFGVCFGPAERQKFEAALEEDQYGVPWRRGEDQRGRRAGGQTG